MADDSQARGEHLDDGLAKPNWSSRGGLGIACGGWSDRRLFCMCKVLQRAFLLPSLPRNSPMAVSREHARSRDSS